MISTRISKLPLALLVAALLALGLAACGSSGDSTQSTASSTTSGEKEADSTTTQGSGSKSDGASSFMVSGGDNSIPTFGEEADAGELKAAEAVLEGYLDARAEGAWAKSCTYLSATSLKPLQRLASSSPQLKGDGCGGILAKLQKATPASSRVSPLIEGLGALRVEGDHGFALFHGPEGNGYFVLMEKDGEGWKVGALVPSEFP